MPRIEIKEFGGLYTNADAYTTLGSPDMENCVIDVNKDILKFGGYSHISSNTVAVSSLTSATNTITTSTVHGLSANDIVLFTSNPTGTGSTLNKKIFKVATVPDTTSFTISSVTEDGTPNGLTVDKRFQAIVHTTTFATSGLALDDVDILGASEFEGEIVAMISNGTNGYLCKTAINTIAWDLVEENVLFNSSNETNFTQYSSQRKSKNYLLFVNNDSESISLDAGGSATGGVFFYDGRTPASNSVQLFGVSNNPSARTITIHNNRIVVGNISKLAGVAIDGDHLVMVSKLFPEAADSTIDESDFATLTITKGVTTKIADTDGTPTVDLSGFYVGDQVYISGTDTDIGQDYLEGKYHTIIEKAATYIVIDTDTSSGTNVPTTFDIGVRGNTWSPATSAYEDALQGAGLLKMDENNGDTVVAVKSVFGGLCILRDRGVWFFNGSLTSGDVTLARQLNIPYGAVSSSVELTDGGAYFASQYGVNKIEGVAVEIIATEVDSISSITRSHPIKPTYDTIATKSAIRIKLVDNYLYVHDSSQNLSLVYNLLNGQWSKITGILAERFISIQQTEYAVYKGLVFQLNSGNSKFDLNSFAASDNSWFYFIKITDLGEPMSFKQIMQLRALIEGAIVSAGDAAILNIDIFYNGSNAIGSTITFDVTGSYTESWNSLTNNGVSTWNTVTNSGADTWNQVLGTVSVMLQRRAFELGVARDIQLRLRESSQYGLRISRLDLECEYISE